MDRAEVEALQHEWQHQEDVMQRIADASTPEGHVAHKAYRRIGELVDELKLDEGHTELAQQASSNSTRKEQNRTDYTFWRQFNEKPGDIPGCPNQTALPCHFQPTGI